MAPSFGGELGVGPARDVVRLERWLGEVADVEGDDDLGVGAYGGGQDLAVFQSLVMPSISVSMSADHSGRCASASARRSRVSHR
jgi:hypothetical protein